MTNTQKILDVLQELKDGQKKLEEGQKQHIKQIQHLVQGQIKINTSIGQLHQVQTQHTKQIQNLTQGQAQLHIAVAQNTTMIETLKESQESSTAAIRSDIHDLAAKIAKNKKETDTRLDALEEHTGLSNPFKN